MRFVDAHFHLWDLALHVYPWMTDPDKRLAGNATPQPESYRIGNFLADADGMGLSGAVHIQAGIDAQQSLNETGWLSAIADDRAQSRGLPDAIVAYADLAAPDLEATLADHCRHARVRGIRQMLNQAGLYPDRYPNLMRDPAWLGGLALLGRLGLSFDLQIYPGQMADAEQVVRAHPGTLFVIDHAGLPPLQTPERMGYWRAELERLARLPNTVLKISGFGMFDRHWTVASVAPFVDAAVALFGARRCLFGSNFPLERLTRSYTRLWTDFAQLIEGHAPADRDAMLYGNTRRVYRMDETR